MPILVLLEQFEQLVSYLLLCRWTINDKKIMLGNIYRPPRNIIDDYNTFFSELVPILTQLNKYKSEVVIVGDFRSLKTQ